jgi:hypothetical protein
MPNVICKNKNCKAYNSIDIIKSIRYVYNDKGDVVEVKGSECPVCNSIREQVIDPKSNDDLLSVMTSRKEFIKASPSTKGTYY